MVDQHWLPETDVRNDSVYMTEAFQRLILQFVLNHRYEEFMDCEAGIEFRPVQQVGAVPHAIRYDC